MARNLTPGDFYEFDRMQLGREIGERIDRNWALSRLLRGQDVYTPLASDAKSLAKDVHPGKADWEGAHEANYFPHFHPGGVHTYGHVFYGGRDYRLGESR